MKVRSGGKVKPGNLKCSVHQNMQHKAVLLLDGHGRTGLVSVSYSAATQSKHVRLIHDSKFVLLKHTRYSLEDSGLYSSRIKQMQSQKGSFG